MKATELLSAIPFERIKENMHGISFMNVRRISRLLRIHPNGSIREISENLSRLAVDLERSCKSVEPDFIKLGEDLQSVYTDADDLMQQMNTSIRLIGGDPQDSLLAKVGKIAKESIKEFKEYQSMVFESLKSVEIVVLQLTSLFTQGKMIEKIAMFLKVVGLNVGIETSRSPEAMEMFGVVAREIKTLSEKIIDIVKTFLDESESAKTGQLKAQKDITKDLDPLDVLADDAEKGTRDAVDQIESFMGLTIKALEKAGEHSRKISRQVGKIVMGIQFHDDMSQRIEHIIRSLSDVERLCRKETSSSEPGEVKTTDEKLSSAYSILTLQIAQLNHVISEIDGVYQKSMEAFEEITGEIGNLAGILSTMGSKASESGNAVKVLDEDPFSNLKSAIEHLQRIHKQGIAIFDRINGTAAKASEATQILSNHAEQVSEISFATHLMALNAIVKAAHLGDKGSTLEVLAQEIKRLTDQSKEFVGAVEMIFETFTTSAHPNTGEIDDGPVESSDSIAGISLKKGVQEISMGYETFKNDSWEAFNKAELLKDTISQTSDALYFLKDLAVKFNEHLEQLEDVRKILSPWGDKMDGHASSETVKLSGNYTMLKERKIHQEFLGPSEDLNTEHPDETAFESRMAESNLTENDADSSDAVFYEEIIQENVSEDNVELFLDGDISEEETRIRMASFKNDKKEQISEYVEAAEISSDRQTDEEDDLGDNVELF